MSTEPPSIHFYRAIGRHGFLSNLYKHSFTYNEIEFPSAENAYQYKKANKQEIRDIIRICPPRIAAIIGHNLQLYDITLHWNAVRTAIMFQVLRAKFQDPVLRRKLLETGDAKLFEDSKSDAFWGTGKKGNGMNMLGLLLMEERERIRGETRNE